MYPQYTKIPLEGHDLPSSGIFFFDFVSNVSRLNDKRPAQQTSSLRATAHHKFITAFGKRTWYCFADSTTPTLYRP